MTENTPLERRQARDEMLDALLDALEERRATRVAAERRVASPPPVPPRPAERTMPNSRVRSTTVMAKAL